MRVLFHLRRRLREVLREGSPDGSQGDNATQDAELGRLIASLHARGHPSQLHREFPVRSGFLSAAFREDVPEGSQKFEVCPWPRKVAPPGQILEQPRLVTLLEVALEKWGELTHINLLLAHLNRSPFFSLRQLGIL